VVPLRPGGRRLDAASLTEDGEPIVSSDTLISLRVADPQNSNAERWLPDDVYDHAFDAWEVARDSVYTAWKELTDPNAFQPDLPLSFRDAYALVLRKGGYLGKDAQICAGQPAAQRALGQGLPAGPRSAQPGRHRRAAHRLVTRCSTRPASPHRRRVSRCRTSRSTRSDS
jgi:hypothetical protein